jgi:hypothetical protein
MPKFCVTYRVLHTVGSGLIPEDGRAHPYGALIWARDWSHAAEVAADFNATVDGEFMGTVPAGDEDEDAEFPPK